jgi:16S rRNA processing protein RimM
VDPSGSVPEGILSAGKVGRAHGLDGSFYVTGARPRLLELGVEVTIAGRTVAIVRRAGTDRRPIVRLEGISDRDAAQAIHGQTLTVAAGQEPALEEGGGRASWRAAVFDGELPVSLAAAGASLLRGPEVRREDGRGW